jgi:hypothetical protein
MENDYRVTFATDVGVIEYNVVAFHLVAAISEAEIRLQDNRPAPAHIYQINVFPKASQIWKV